MSLLQLFYLYLTAQLLSRSFVDPAHHETKCESVLIVFVAGSAGLALYEVIKLF